LDRALLSSYIVVVVGMASPSGAADVRGRKGDAPKR